VPLDNNMFSLFNVCLGFPWKQIVGTKYHHLFLPHYTAQLNTMSYFISKYRVQLAPSLRLLTDVVLSPWTQESST